MTRKKMVVLSLSILMMIWSGTSLEAAPLESLVPQKDIPEGWTLIDGPRTYNKKTLFEHIDGQAELFLKYRFQKSVFAIYQSREKPDHQIELDIYDMGNVLHAFGVFSRFRNEDRPMGIGLDSFLEGGSALFYKGKYFVMIYGTEPNPSFLKEWAMKVSSGIPDHSPPPEEIGYFPKRGLKPGSIQYFPEGLLGHQFLKRGFQGTYISEAEGKEYHLFLAIFKNSQEAINVLKIYKDHLSKKGRIDSGSPHPFGLSGFKGKDPYQGKLFVLQKGHYLLGIVGFEKEKEAENRLIEFAKNVK